MKKFIAGFLTCLIIMASTFIFAETTQTIQAVFGRVRLIVDGKPVDEETLLYNGTTYVPLRAAAEALGKEVYYDTVTKTAYIGIMPKDAQKNTLTQEEILYLVGIREYISKAIKQYNDIDISPTNLDKESAVQLANGLKKKSEDVQIKSQQIKNDLNNGKFSGNLKHETWYIYAYENLINIATSYNALSLAITYSWEYDNEKALEQMIIANNSAAESYKIIPKNVELEKQMGLELE